MRNLFSPGTLNSTDEGDDQAVTSSRPFLPFALVMTVVALISILVMVIMIGVTVYVTKKYKGSNKGACEFHNCAHIH